jgi:hypothetical protein
LDLGSQVEVSHVEFLLLYFVFSFANKFVIVIDMRVSIDGSAWSLFDVMYIEASIVFIPDFLIVLLLSNHLFCLP